MLRVVSSIVMVLLLLLPVGIWWMAWRPLPSLDGVVTISDLKSSVIVQFDGRGVPYVESRSEDDLYFAQGYLTARDRLFQMDILRRTALGELSEVFGAGTLGSDKLMRTIGFGRLAKLESQKLSPAAASSLNSYCRGINYLIRQDSDNLPFEFSLLGYKPKQWRPEDSLAILKYLSYQLDDSWQLDDLRQQVFDRVGDKRAGELFADYDGKPFTFAQTVRASDPTKQEAVEQEAKKVSLELQSHFGRSNANVGSTCFAVSGVRADHGSCLLAADKHMPYTVPDSWWLCSLSSPTLKVAGATMTGVPGVIVGRNNEIAWSSASMKADVQDLYLEEFSQQFANQYRVGSGWQTADEITEKINVRFSKPYEHKIVSTNHGPVLLKNGNSAIVLSWMGENSESSSLESYWKVNRSTNWDSFLTSLKDFSGAPQVFIYCDRQGNFGFHGAGGVPVRTGAGQGVAITPGWQSSGQWLGKIQFDDLPWGYNPKEGYVVAANQKIPASRAVLIGHQSAPPYRANRVGALLNYYQKVSRRVGLPDLNQIQSDSEAPLAMLVRQRISEAIEEGKVIDRQAIKALDVLTAWDGQLTANSAGAAIYESFMYTLAKRIIEPKLGPELTVKYLNSWPLWVGFTERFLNDKANQWLPPEERTYSTFIITTLSQALGDLNLKLRNDDPTKFRWQDLHKIRFEHVINKGNYALAPLFNFGFNFGLPGVGGDSNSINSFDVVIDAKKRTFGSNFNSAVGPTMRLLVDLSDQDKFYQSISLGQSGQLLSSNLRNQLQPWLRIDPLPVAFSGKQAEKQAQHKLILVNHLEAGQR